MNREILDQHADEVAFLWLLRDASALAPSYDRASLAELDDRIDAHLDGLRIAGAEGAEACEAALAESEPGSVFATAVLAAERKDTGGMESALALAEASVPAARAVTSALGWVPFETALPVIGSLLAQSAPAARRRIGIAASAAHRKDPGEPLAWAVLDGEPRLRARALRAAGELGRQDLLPALRDQLGSERDEHRYWAAWSAALLGEGAATGVLWRVALAGGPFAAQACALAVRKLEARDARSRVDDIAALPDLARVAIAGAEALGDPASVPWLLSCLEAPALARPAAEAFSMITGAVIERELAGGAPEGFRAGPSDDPQKADVAMDPDRALPWPAAEAVRAWWKARDRQFRRGVRYLGGAPLTVESLQAMLRTGSQKRRAAAALELAAREPNRPLAEVRGRERA